MSTESTIDAIITDLRISAVNAASHAGAMVASAASTLAYTPKFPDGRSNVMEAGVDMGGFSGAPEVVEKVPQFPTVGRIKLPDAPALTDIAAIRRRFEAKAPYIDMIVKSYRRPSDLAAFREVAPKIDTDVDIPEKPDIALPDRPTPARLNPDFEVENISVPALRPTRPTYTPGTLPDWDDLFSAGWDKIPSLDAEAHRILDRLFPGFKECQAALCARIDGVLTGKETALTERFEQSMYDAMRARLALERERGLQAVDDAALAAGWALPGAVRFAGQMRVETEYGRASNAAALEVYTKRAEREVQHLQFVMQLAASLFNTAVEVFSKALGIGLEAFKAALAYAEAAGRFAALVYELRQKDFAIFVQVMEAEIKLFEALLRAELAKLETVKARAEIEKLKGDVNRLLIEQYTAELRAGEVRASLYASEISALRALIDLRRAPLDVYEAKVRAYGALSDAKRNEYAALEAEIRGDQAHLEGQLAKLKVYQTQADVFRTEVEADSALVTAQAKRNEAVLEEFKTRVSAAVSQVQIDEAVAKNALDAYKAMSDIYLAQATHALELRRFAFEKSIKDAEMELKELEFNFGAELENVKLELSRRESLGQLQMSAAGVHGSIASSALSALNSLVSISTTEEL